MFKYILNRIVYNLIKINNRINHRYLPDNFLIYKSDFISNEIISNGLFEEFELKALEQNLFKKIPNDIILDIGANIGNHSVFFTKFFKEVYSFEPHPINFQVLKLNTKNNDNCKIFQLGLSNKKIDSKYLNLGEKNNFGSFQVSSKKTEFKINLVKLDDHFKNKFFKPNIIKLDVEGHELNVLEGASKILNRSSSVIIFEMMYLKNFKKLMNIYKKHKYNFFYEFYFSKLMYTDRPNTLKRFKINFFLLLIFQLFFKRKFYSLLKIEKFENRQYPLIIASKVPLN